MKFRLGFVSNSSNSSFVIAFPHRPKTIEDLRTMMFGTQNVHYAGIYCCYPDQKTNEVPTDEIAKAVWEQVRAKRATRQEVIESIANGYFDPYIDEQLCPGWYNVMEDPRWKELHEKFHRDKTDKEDPQYFEELNKLFDEGHKINEERATKIADFFIESNKGKFLAVMNFEDHDPFNAMLEHSNIFGRIEHIRTSYH